MERLLKKGARIIFAAWVIQWTFVGCGKEESLGPASTPATQEITQEVDSSLLDHLSPYVEQRAEVKPGDSVQIYAQKTSNPKVTYEWRLIPPSGSNSILSDAHLNNPFLVPDKKGIYVAWVVAKAGKYVTQPIPLTIRVKNRAPLAVIGTNVVSGIVGTVFQLDGSKSSDPDGDLLSFAWHLQGPDGSLAQLSSMSATKSSFKADKKGKYKLSLVVTDGEDQSELALQDNIDIANSLPTFKTNLSRTSATLDDTVDLNILQPFDLDGDPLKILWKIRGVDETKDVTLDLSGDQQHFKAVKRGKYEITASVSDGEAEVKSPILKLTVINRNPVADLKLDPHEATVGKMIHLDARGSKDPDGDVNLLYKWTINDGEKVMEGKDVTYTVATKKNQKIKLEISDGLGGKTLAEDSIRIINQSPQAVILTVPLKGSISDTFHLFSHGGPDLDGDPLTHQWEIRDKEDGSLVAQKSGEEIDMKFTKKSQYEVRLTVSDGDTIVRSDPVILSLENRPPQAKAYVSLQDAHIRDRIQVKSLTPDDPDGDWVTTSWKITQPNGELIEFKGIENAFEVMQIGLYKVLLTVHDGFSFSEDYKEIRVSNTKPIAVAKATPLSMVGRVPVALDGRASYDDDVQDLGKLSYQWRIVSQPSDSSAALGVDEIKSQLSFLPMLKGTYNLELQVSDGVSKSDPAYVSISVENNPPKILSLTAPKTTTFIDENVILSAKAQSDNGVIKYQWKVDPSDQASLTRAELNSQSPIFKGLDKGHYVVSLVVNDGASDSAPESVAFDVVNREPSIDVMSVSPQILGQRGTVTLSASASDADIRHVSVLKYEWNILDEAHKVIQTILGKTGEFMVPERKTYEVKLTVSDPYDKVTQSKSVNVVNEAPKISDVKMDPTLVYLNDRVTLRASVSDLEKDGLGYLWSVKDSSGKEILSDDQKILENPQFDISQKGQFQVSLTLSDFQGAKSEKSFSFEIQNHPVQLSEIYVTRSPYLVGNILKLSSNVFDSDFDMLKYFWEVWKGPTLITSFNDAEPSFIPPSYGEYTIKLKVQDSKDSANLSSLIKTENRNPYNAQIEILTQPAIYNREVQAKCQASDLDLDALTCDWEFIDPDGMVSKQSLASSQISKFTPTKFGSYEVRLTVKDPQGASAPSVSGAFLVENHAPQIKSVQIPATLVNGGSGVFTVTAEDSESPIEKLIVQWKFMAPESVTAILSGRSVTYSPTAKGTITCEVHVKDEQGLETSRLATFTVSNAPSILESITFTPTVQVIDSLARLQKGDSYTLGIPLQNPDGDPLTYSWAVSGGATLTQDQTINAKLTAIDYGTFNVSVAVSDGTATVSKSQGFKIQSRPPAVSVVLDPGIQVETLGEMKFIATMTDPDGDVVTPTWSVTTPNGQMTALTDTTSTVVYIPSVSGNYKVQVIAQDSSGSQAKAEALFSASSGIAWGAPAPNYFDGYIGCYHPYQWGEDEALFYDKVLRRKGFFRLSPQVRPGFPVDLNKSLDSGKIFVNSKYISVADKFNHRVQIFDKDECLAKARTPNYQTFFGASTDTSLQIEKNEACFCMPKYVIGAPDAADPQKNVMGTGSGEFNLPTDSVFLENAGKSYLWVSDTKNKRLQLFEMADTVAFVKEVKLGYEPKSLAAFQDKLFVVNTSVNSTGVVIAGEIDVYSWDGNFINGITLPSSTTSSTKGVGNIEATSDGIVFAYLWDGSSYNSGGFSMAYDARTFIALSKIGIPWMDNNSPSSFIRSKDMSVFPKGELVFGNHTFPSLIYKRSGNSLINCMFSDASTLPIPEPYNQQIANHDWIFKHFYTNIPSGKRQARPDDLYFFNSHDLMGPVGAFGNHLYINNLVSHEIVIHHRNVISKDQAGLFSQIIKLEPDGTYNGVYKLCTPPQ